MSIPRGKDSQHLTKSSSDPFFFEIKADSVQVQLIGDAKRLQDLVQGCIITRKSVLLHGWNSYLLQGYHLTVC